MRRIGAACGVVACLLALALPPGAPAQQEPTRTSSPEEQAAAEAWQKFATPGEGHRSLEALAGSWQATVTMWRAPGAPAQVSTGSAEATMILGGRYLEEHFTGVMEGMPFAGVGLTGYDNYKQRYVVSWADTMGTGILKMTGSYDPARKEFAMEGEVDDVVARKPVRFREVIRVVSADRHVAEMFVPDTSGREFKMLEIVYARK